MSVKGIQVRDRELGATFCFEKQGYDKIIKDHCKVVKNESVMIIYVYTSRSMNKSARYVAKTFEPYLAARANMQRLSLVDLSQR